jgi:hypothetical protein
VAAGIFVLFSTWVVVERVRANRKDQSSD